MLVIRPKTQAAKKPKDSGSSVNSDRSDDSRETIWLELGSLLSESVESVADKKEPSRGEQGISDDGEAEARKREGSQGHRCPTPNRP